MSGFSITVNAAGLDAAMDATVAQAAAAARPAAQAGAQVLYDTVRANVLRRKGKTGNLAASIYQAYSANNSKPGGKQVYHVSWNASKAPHGGLVEFGHQQRYEVFRTPDGRFLSMVRPEKRGQPRPRRKASQAEKDAYYLPREGGPKQVPARPFIRSSVSAFPAAELAMRTRWLAELQATGVIK